VSRLSHEWADLDDRTAWPGLDSAEFDAYRELGACSVQLALEQSHLPASVGLEKLSADSQVIR
jgi:hypothetical protein